jgi:WD40 repeat protein
MASPDAARSPWVNREVEWWLANKSPQRLLVVLTEGEFAWADTGNGDGARAALPPALRGAFVETPRWVDLRWLHDVDQVDQSNPRLRECVADVAAAVREVAKDELVGEHIHQHRRTVRLARGGVTLLVVLLIAALAAAVVAVGQRNQAVAAQHTAIARGMVAQADKIRDRDPRGALQLGIAANQLDPSPLSHASLMQTLMSSRYHGTLTGHTSWVDAVAFSPDGRVLATGSWDGTVLLWDLGDRAQPHRLGQSLDGHDKVDAVAFSPDGRVLAAATWDDRVILWDLSDRAQPRQLGQLRTGHVGAVGAVAFSADGRTLATAHELFTSDITSSDQIVTSLILWDLSDRAQPRQLSQFSIGHVGAVEPAVAFSPDGRTLATNGDDHTVILWDLSDRTQPRRLGQPLTGHPTQVVAVEFSPDGRTLTTVSDDHTVILWDLSDRTQAHRISQLHTAAMRAAAFSPDGRTLATGSDDDTVSLWDLSDRTQPRRLGQPLTGHTGWVVAVAFSPDGRTLATGSTDQTVILWDLSDRAHPRRLGPPLTGHTEAVDVVAFSPDGRTLATGSTDRTVILWDLSDRAHPRRLGPPLTGHINTVDVFGFGLSGAVAFSPNGRTLATNGDYGTVILWDLSDRTRPRRLGEPVSVFTGLSSYDLSMDSYSMAFSPDGRTLATGSTDQTVTLWDVTEPTRLRRLDQPPTGRAELAMHTVAFSPDGRTVATRSTNQTVILWDVTEPTEPRWLDQLLTGHPASGHSINLSPQMVAFSPDGHTLATADTDHTVSLWDLNPVEELRRDAIREACTRAGGPLNEATWNFYAPGISYQNTCANR